jgi:hypothetical protein
LTKAVEPSAARACPWAKLAPTTGMSCWTGVPSVRLDASATNNGSRSGVLPWLKMITASAPACSAKNALSPKLQVPRWMSAMSAGPEKSRPAKSASSQPLVEARFPVRLMSTGVTVPSRVPAPLPVYGPVS